MMHRLQRTHRTWMAWLSLALASACGGGDSTSPSSTRVPPTVSITSSSATLVSGATLTLDATVRDDRGAVVSSPSIVWSSSDSAVATVAAGGAVTGIRAGNVTITARALGAAGSAALTVVPGAPAALAAVARPTTAVAGERLSAVVLEIRDRAGNTVPTATGAVEAALDNGGPLRGLTTVAATRGTVTFDSLFLDGTIGSRTLIFTVAGLAPATVGPIPLRAGRAVALTLQTQPANAAAGQPLGTQPVVQVRDAFGNLTDPDGPVTVALNGGGRLSGSTSIPTASGVAVFTTLAVSGIIGARSLSFTTPGVPSVESSSFVLAAGPAAAVVLTRPPSGAGLNGVFTTQPVLELRDASGNRSTSNATVTAAISTGGGSLTGATATAVNGAATFSGLGIAGTPGARTLVFGSGALSTASTSVTPCDGVRGPRLSTAAPLRALSAPRTGTSDTDSVTIVDEVGSCTAITALTTAISYTSGNGWLTATTQTAPPRVALTAAPTGLAVGEYRATITVSAAGAASLSLPVVFTVRPTVTVTYGAATERINELDVGTTARIVATARNDANVDLSGTITYVSRSPATARVASDGTITALQVGPAWLVATEPSGGADSVFLNVRRTAGPILRLDLSSITQTFNSTFSVNVILDTRGTTVGAAQIVFAWPTAFRSPGTLQLLQATAGTTGNPQITSDTEAGLTRIAIASASGVRGVVSLGRFDFRGALRGGNVFVLSTVDILDAAGASLAPSTTAFQYPVVIR